LKESKTSEILFITYNESYSGIYQSQIIDVARHLEKNSFVKTKIICLAPIKLYFQFRKKFKSVDSKIIVLPSFPKMLWWKFNTIMLQIYLLFSKPAAVIARNPIATNIALELKKKGCVASVCFDARGAFSDEFKEYLTENTQLQQLAFELEKNALLKSDFSIIVSNKLLEHYKNIYHYNSLKNVIIPTTLDNSFNKVLPNVAQIKGSRKKFNIPENAIVISFSAGNADWQSFKNIDNFYIEQIAKNKNIYALLLTKVDISSWDLPKKFPNSYLQTFVKHNEVFELLSLSDYGLLLRDNSITNNVASPTKCAEYLACGLPIIISEKIGDYSDFILKNNLGFIYKNQVLSLTATSKESRELMQNFAKANFYKDSIIIKEKYNTLLSNLIS